jgi:hypothetical protein
VPGRSVRAQIGDILHDKFTCHTGITSGQLAG